MGSAVKVQFHCRCDRASATAECYARTVSMKHGTVEVHWLDAIDSIIMCEPDSREQFCKTLKDRVSGLCSEHANTIAEWPHLMNMATRVNAQCFRWMRTWLDDFNAASPPPQMWFRMNYMLLKGRAVSKETPMSTAEEQLWAWKRILHAALLATASNGNEIKPSHPHFWGHASRKFSEAERKRLVVITRKYLEGMHAAGRFYEADLLGDPGLTEQFMSGEQ